MHAGELRALRVEAVDLDADVIHVRAGWDDVKGEIETRSTSGDSEPPYRWGFRRS
jgi:hypothetical protein